jgi:polyhydroxyalkanoate synthesis regulator phasin
MTKKRLITFLTLVMLVAVPFTVFAATADTPTARKVRGYFGIDTSKLTDAQKSDITAYSTKMADLEKEFINKMVENGTITKEQGDTAINSIDDKLKNGDGMDILKGLGGRGRGGKEGFGRMKIDTSKLTDKQKTDLENASKKMLELQKSFIKDLVDNSIITKVQGDSMLEKLDNTIKNTDGLGYGLAFGKGGFGFLGLQGIDTSKLTDAQKKVLTDDYSKMAELQKEIINTMVSNGLITKDQGTAENSMIDQMLKNIEENGFHAGFGPGMRKGGFRGKWQENNNSLDSNTSTTQRVE